eukprot:960061-Ditylum_brightwellii.AAC.1
MEVGGWCSWCKALWLVCLVGDNGRVCGQECESARGDLCLLEWPMAALLEDALRQSSLFQTGR